MMSSLLRKKREFYIQLLGSIALHIAGLALTVWIALPKDYQASEDQ